MKGKTNSQVGGTDLTLIWVGFLKVCFALEEGEITPCLNFFRIVNFVGPLILLRTAFFCKKSAFFSKNSAFIQSNSMGAEFEISFYDIKGCY